MDLTRDIPKNYDPKTIEDRWYQYWLDNGYFKSDPDSSKKPYTILIPPPNVTGNLHMGHALNNCYQDTMIRFKKMEGYNTLWVPGTDHGGIATQNVVERELAKDNKTKEDIGREQFLNLVQEWKDTKRANIVKQLQKLGCSCDWRREQFTMSDNLSFWVKKAFVQLYNKDLIFRDHYIVNWCPRCTTALANDEVKTKSQDSYLYYVRYYFEDSKDYLIIATTRPETILGDVAVAFNPKDSRYNSLQNKNLVVPIINRVVPLVPDDYVKQDFGSGLVKITPAHDKNDFKIGRANNLEELQIINKCGKICNTNTKYDGMDRFEARKLFIEELEEKGLMEKVDDYTNTIGHCYRCQTVVEPYLSDQWFVRMGKLSEAGLDVVNSGGVKMVPDAHAKIFNHWFKYGKTDEIEDWCISRQIWWGHQIPIWYCENSGCKNIMTCNLTSDDKLQDPTQCSKCNSTNLQRDQDVLDTWFSSALWGFSVFEKKEDLDYYYPTSVLITGKDILFFWVARMVIASLELTNNVPFYETFLHGVVRDENGEKMSKSKGNVIDPLDIVDQFSADSLRFTLALTTPKGEDVRVSNKSFELGKTFCTKLWNSVRYLLMNIKESSNVPILTDQQLQLGGWILDKLNQCIQTVTTSLNNYDFMEATKAIYIFTWDHFCNNYLEFVKPSIDDPQIQNILCNILSTILRLLHPFIPFLTEELYHLLFDKTDSILDESWPKPYNLPDYDPKIDEYYNTMWKIINKIRSVKGEFKIDQTTDVHIYTDDIGLIEYVDINRVPIIKLTKINGLVFDNAGMIKFDVDGIHIGFIGGIDVDVAVKNLNQKIDVIQKKIKKSEGFMAKKKLKDGKKAKILDEISKHKSHIAEYQMVINELEASCGL